MGYRQVNSLPVGKYLSFNSDGEEPVVLYFDDTESYLYRIEKKAILSIINDAISDVIKGFYYSNYDGLIYTKYFQGSGLSKFQKLSEIGTEPKMNKIWKYNFIFSKI